MPYGHSHLIHIFFAVALAVFPKGRLLSQTARPDRVVVGCGPLWSPPHDDDGHRDGRGSPSGTGLDFKTRHVLLFLLLQRPRLCLWRPTAQPGTLDKVV